MQKRQKFNTARGVIAVLATILVLEFSLASQANARDIENETPPVTARTRGPSDHYWVDLGVGASRLGPGVLMSFSILHQSTQWMVRFAHMEEFQLCIFGPCQSQPADNNSLGVLFGKTAHFSHGFLSINVGPGIHWGTNDDGVSFLTAGAAAQTEAFVSASAVGIGLIAFADVNPAAGFIPGGILALRIGSLSKQRS